MLYLFSVFRTRGYPYKGIGDALVCELADRIISEMVKRKMNVAGIYCAMTIRIDLFIT